MTQPRKRPIIFLFVWLAVFMFGGYLGIISLMATYTRLKGIPLVAIPNPIGMLIAIPALFLWCPVSLVISNGILFVIPPLRKIAERYTAQSGGPGFYKAQTQLLKLSLGVALVCLPLIALGFWL